MTEEELSFATDERLRKALREVEAQPAFSGLGRALAQYRRNASGTPDNYEFEMWSELNPKRLGGDRIGVTRAILSSLAIDLLTAKHMIVYDVDQLLDLVHSGLRDRSFRHAVLAARAILERAAVTESHLRFMRSLFANLPKLSASRIVRGTVVGQALLDEILPRVEAAQTVRRHLVAQSFNWSVFDRATDQWILKKGDPKKQVQVGDGIKLLDAKGPFPDRWNLWVAYSLLCDYVHPNFGASNLFVDTQEEFELRSPDGVENRLLKRRLSRHPEDISALTHVFSVIYLPLREALLVTASHLDWLINEQAARRRELTAFDEAVARLPRNPRPTLS